MKNLLITTLLLISMQGIGQYYYDSPKSDTIFRNHSDSTGNYLIEYRVNYSWGFTPAVDGARPHWGAEIIVYEVRKRWYSINGKVDTIPLAVIRNGTYVEGGCFEDTPERWVQEARVQVRKAASTSESIYLRFPQK